MVIRRYQGTSQSQGMVKRLNLGLTRTYLYVVASAQKHSIHLRLNRDSQLPRVMVWTLPPLAFLLPHPKSPMDTNTPPDALPSLKLMETANRLLKKAAGMDSSEIDQVMDSFPKADHNKKWEIISTMFLLVVFHPATNAEVVYEHLKKLLMVARGTGK